MLNFVFFSFQNVYVFCHQNAIQLLFSSFPSCKLRHFKNIFLNTNVTITFTNHRKITFLFLCFPPIDGKVH